MAMEIFTMMRRSSGSGSICPAKDWHTLSSSYGYICRSTSKILDSLMFFFPNVFQSSWLKIWVMDDALVST